MDPLTQTTGYGDAAGCYLDAGWRGVLPLPAGAKSDPPAGYTGEHGAWPTTTDLTAWCTSTPDGNVALRLDRDVIGIDLDLYKQPDARAALELLLGVALPPTWRTTSRTDGSGIYLYRVPPLPDGQRWCSAPVPGVEVVQYRHRYAVVWPSLHPEGRRYRWDDDAGEPADRVPSHDDLADLPFAAVTTLTETSAAYTNRPFEAFTFTDGEPSDDVRHRIRVGHDVCGGEIGSRHDRMLSVVMGLVRAAEHGEPGVHAALEELGAVFVDAVASDRPGGRTHAEKKFRDMVAGAYTKAATTADWIRDIESNGQPAASSTTTSLLERLRARLHVGRAVCALPPPVPLVDGLFFMPSESVLYGPPKVGKTFFGLDLALSIATGTPFMGRTVTQGPVLYVVAEGVGGLGARVDAWCRYHDRDDIDAAMFLATAVNLTDRGSVNALCTIIGDTTPVLVAIDTLARCTVGSDENSAKDMGLVVAALDQLRDESAGHIQAVHHAGKDLTRGMRGSNALLGAVDTVIELSGDMTSIHAKVTAQKDAAAADDWWCRLEPSVDSVVIVEASGAALEGLSRNLVLDALEALPAEDRTSTKWQHMAESMGVGERTFYRAKKLLIDTGWVHGGGRRGALYVIANERNEP